MISALEYTEPLDLNSLFVKASLSLREVFVEYLGIDSNIVEESFALVDGETLRRDVLSIVRRLDVTDAEYSRIYYTLNSFANTLDEFLAED